MLLVALLGTQARTVLTQEGDHEQVDEQFWLQYAYEEQVSDK